MERSPSMAPERSPKRVTTNPVNEDNTPKIPAAESPLLLTTDANHPDKPQEKLQDDSRRASWYNRTWPRKATPLTEVARQSISSASNTAIEAIASSKKTLTATKTARSPSLAMTLGKSKTTRALPAEATTSTIHAKPEALTVTKASLAQSARRERSKSTSESNKESVAQASGQMQGAKEKKQNADPMIKTVDGPAEQTTTSGKAFDQSRASWLSWLSKTEAILEGTNRKSEDTAAVEDPPMALSSELALQESNMTDHIAAKSEETTSEDMSNKRSWLQMWSPETPTKSAPASIRAQSETKSQANSTPLPIRASRLKADPSTPGHSQASSMETSPPPQLPGDGSKSAGWVFWSRERNNNSSTASIDRPHVGEIAISNTPSAGRPKRASISVPKGKDGTEPNPSFSKEAAKDTPKNAPPSSEIISSAKPASLDDTKTKVTKTSKDTKLDPDATKIESTNATAVAKPPAEAESLATAACNLSRKSSEVKLLPLFKDTFSPEQSPSLLQQLGRLLYYTKVPDPKHLSLVKDPPRIRNALAIGVHGYFPAPLIRTVLGQPTGTSIKFADMAAKSIKSYTKSRGYECQVKTAALEGEGKIAERIDLLWKLLLNWIDEIRKADFVMIACHSQGVPVAIMLVAKLIDFGCVNSARIGICAMAGVNMGPFLDYKSRWISGSAGELFEFSDPTSRVSHNYMTALQTVLKSGCCVLFIGSIDDQLVSLESSLFTPVSHPHIYRAVLVDGRTHAPNFLSHLVGFALKLRNLGVQDHGLIRELSSPLAGSLYSGEGHSRIYEDEAVYALAVEFALETNELKNVEVVQRQASSGTAGNPYILPFAMRGILEEDFVKTELQKESAELLEQFDDWRPTTKALKDVKFRLEGIRSKLRYSKT